MAQQMVWRPVEGKHILRGMTVRLCELVPADAPDALIPNDVREAIETLRALVVVIVATNARERDMDASDKHYMNAARTVRTWLDSLKGTT